MRQDGASGNRQEFASSRHFFSQPYSYRCKSRPEGIESPALLGHLRETHGVTLAPGQGALKPNVFRIGHIGWFDVFDIAAALAAVELSLTELGADIERGVAVSRAFEAYEQRVAA